MSSTSAGEDSRRASNSGAATASSRKCSKSARPPAPHIGGGQRGGEARRTLAEHALQMAVRRTRLHLIGTGHALLEPSVCRLPVGVDDAMVYLAHRRQVCLETLLES